MANFCGITTSTHCNILSARGFTSQAAQALTMQSFHTRVCATPTHPNTIRKHAPDLQARKPQLAKLAWNALSHACMSFPLLISMDDDACRQGTYVFECDRHPICPFRSATQLRP